VGDTGLEPGTSTV